MAKKLFIIPFLVVSLLGVPIMSNASAMIEIIENEYQEISITVKASTIHVNGANGQTLHIYNVAGVRVMSIKVDGQDRSYDLNLQKGCYIVKVGKVVKKSKKFKAHDENNECGVGDTVLIMETRPLSKDKHHRVVKIIKKAE